MKKILLFLSFLLMSIGVWSTDATFRPSDFTGQGTSGSGSAISATVSTVTFSCNKGYGTTQVRCYSGSKITISSTNTITAISFIFSDSYTGGLSTSYTGLSTTSWEQTLSSQARITQLVVTYSGGQTYTITAVSNNTTYGTVSLDGTTITATPALGYRVSTTTPYTVTSGTATVAQDGNTFTVTAESDCTIRINFEVATTPPSPEPSYVLVFKLLTSVNDLQDGDNIIIVESNNSVAMSTVQNGNNRGESDAFDITNDTITLHDNTIQILEVHNTNGLWELYTGSGYLCAASSSSNYLRTQSPNDNNGKWEISITNDIASIVAQGSFTRNVIRYNESSDIFSCYDVVNSQSPIKIYKKIECDDEYTVTFKSNGITHSIKHIPSCVKRLVELPSIPENDLFCNNSAIFVGWSESDIATTNTKPNVLFQTIKNSPVIDSDKTFYAVFANEQISSPIDETFEFTIDGSDFKGGGYAVNDGEHISIASPTNPTHTDTVHVKWMSFDVLKSKGMQWKSGKDKASDAGYIYNTTDLCNINNLTLFDADGTFTKYFGTTKHPNSSTEIGTGNGYFCVLNGNTKGKTSKIVVNFTKNITPKSYSNYTTYCIDTLQLEGNWTDSTKWKNKRVPGFNEAAIILKPVTVNIPHAVAKYVVIHQHDTCTGKVTISDNKGLEIQDTISVYDGTTYHPTTPNDLILESSDAGNASLIFNNNNGDSATVHLYSKATYPGLDGSNADWQYIGTSITSLNALYNYYGSWLYEWVGGDEKWHAVPNGGMMEAWKGYCITQNEIACHETSGQLVPTNNIIELPIDSPYTVVANSWTAPIHIGAFLDKDFDSISDLRIYLFNTGFDPGGDSAVYETRHNSPGTYVVIPIHAAQYLDKDSLIPSQQGFFVKTNTDGHLILDYDRIVRTGGSGDIVAGPLRAPKRAAADDKPNVLKIYANGSRFSDRLTILEREDFTTSLDNGWDGDKMGFSNLAPSIYVINEDGSYDEVSAIPDYEGTLIGFKAGTDIVYSITFDYDGDETIYLNDMLTQTSTLIDNESKYVFTSDGSEEVRFVISATPYAGVATDIDNLTEQSNTTHKFLYNGNLYILKNNCIFNVVGSLIK